MKKTEIIPAAIATFICMCITGWLGLIASINCGLGGTVESYFHCSFLTGLYLIEGFVGLLIFLSNIASFAFKNENERKIVHMANLIYISVAVLSLITYVVAGGGAAFR